MDLRAVFTRSGRLVKTKHDFGQIMPLEFEINSNDLSHLNKGEVCSSKLVVFY